MTLNRITQFTALLLIPALLNNSMAYAARKPLDASTVKEMIAMCGVDQRVRVTLADKTEAKGLIVSIGDQSFGLTAKGANHPQNIQYSQVTGVHGYGLSRNVKVGIFVGAGMTTVLLLAVVAIKKLFPFQYHD